MTERGHLGGASYRRRHYQRIPDSSDGTGGVSTQRGT